MSLARSALLRASRSQWLADQMARRAFARRAVGRFMPGEDSGAALDAAAAMARDGIGAVVTQLGENLTSLAEADAVREHYLGVLGAIADRGLDAVVSVKPTQLGLDLSPDACFASADALAARAAGTPGRMLWVDMEDSSYVDRTLELYRRLRAKHDNVGLCLQAYLRRTPADLESLLPLRPAIRLVKGAYAEPPHVAFPVKRDVDLAFYALADTLLSARARGVLTVLGTHDIGLIERIADRATALGAADGAYEIHMLYGIRSTDQRALAARGRTVRCLISYGSAWFPWYMRRLAERPANVWFVLKSML